MGNPPGNGGQISTHATLGLGFHDPEDGGPHREVFGSTLERVAGALGANANVAGALERVADAWGSRGADATGPGIIIGVPMKQ